MLPECLVCEDFFFFFRKKKKRQKKKGGFSASWEKGLCLMIWRESLLGIAYSPLVHLTQLTALKEML